MVPLKIQNIIKFPLVLLTITALVFGFFCMGMFHKSGVAMENMNVAGITAVEGEQTCCGGSMSQHMQSWTNTFLSIPREARDVLTLFALGLLLAFVAIRTLFAQKSSNDLTFSYKQYLRHHPNLFAQQPLRLAFARGILNTKVY